MQITKDKYIRLVNAFLALEKATEESEERTELKIAITELTE